VKKFEPSLPRREQSHLINVVGVEESNNAICDSSHRIACLILGSIRQRRVEQLIFGSSFRSNLINNYSESNEQNCNACYELNRLKFSRCRGEFKPDGNPDDYEHEVYGFPYLTSLLLYNLVYCVTTLKVEFNAGTKKKSWFQDALQILPFWQELEEIEEKTRRWPENAQANGI
jgi:hypothetical protein